MYVEPDDATYYGPPGSNNFWFFGFEHILALRVGIILFSRLEQFLVLHIEHL